MNNQIYFRIGRPNRFKKPSVPLSPLKLFLIKLSIILTLLYFGGKYVLSLIW